WLLRVLVSRARKRRSSRLLKGGIRAAAPLGHESGLPRGAEAPASAASAGRTADSARTHRARIAERIVKLRLLDWYAACPTPVPAPRCARRPQRSWTGAAHLDRSTWRQA